MKKTLLLSVMLMAGLITRANTVSVDTATRIAEDLFGVQTKAGGSKVALVWDGRGPAGEATPSSLPPFYVFNNEKGGFVVVAADDSAYPILAYSPTGSFAKEAMPENIRNWFNGYSTQIDYARSIGAKPSAEIARMWAETKAPQSIVDLATALWSQSEPYNNLCPVVDDEKSVTGCVATAMSEIMYHHKWPKSQSAELPAYSYVTSKGNKRVQEGHKLAASYSWDKMLKAYSGVYSAEAGDAVATLMFDVGVSVLSAYNFSGTGAYSEDVPASFVAYYDYDASIRSLFRDEMTYNAWVTTIRKELDESRPVFYAGCDVEVGHAFVVDGYGTDDFFHINFGWGGADNGMYRLDAIQVDKYNFKLANAAIVNIKPNEGGEPEPKIQYAFKLDGQTGLTLKSGEVKKGGSITLSAKNIQNVNFGFSTAIFPKSVMVDFSVALFDKNGNVKERYKSTGQTELKQGQSVSGVFTFTISTDIELGDYFMLCCKPGSEWIPVTSNCDSVDELWDYSKYGLSDKVAAYHIPAIKLNPDGYSDGDVLELEVYNSQYITTVEWLFDGTPVSALAKSIRLTSGKHTLRAIVKSHKESFTETPFQTHTIETVIVVK